MNSIEDKSIIIKVADVTINTEALATVDGNSMLTSIVPNIPEGSSIAKNASYIELHKEKINANHFLLMLQFAFNQHKPISITPDDIWLLICQGFAEHIKLYSEDFKDMLGVNEKQTIQVRRDDFVIGGDNPWEEVFPEFTKKIAQILQDDVYHNVILEFSTSTKKEINAFEIAFMDAMSNYFDYEFISLCGIPEIEIRGTVEDYNKMITALEALKKYQLDWWIDPIILNINKIIQTLEGVSNTDFWNSIYKENNESGGPFITGWIADFFPYTKTNIIEEHGHIDYSKSTVTKEQILKTIRIEDVSFDDYNIKIHKVVIRNPRFVNANDMMLKIDDFPSGLSTVPFKWKFFDTEIDMNFISGFIGIKESKTHNTLQTDINWIVNRK
ncbi:DUF4419 domain-containing protein [uncultured Dokdonia sp.]|uniref:DUF4419 domain-containing protein n=1 Tax=uncultured Dokdonia sp. TaxID=575653 RepID=UPI002602E74A|nr:DUF4419 domain-containing protein [uncultured Dokdonia sp.]